VAKGVVREAPLLLEIENEGPDFIMADLSYICAYALRGEEVLKVGNVVGDDGYGVGAFAFSGGTELVTLKQTFNIGAKF